MTEHEGPERRAVPRGPEQVSLVRRGLRAVLPWLLVAVIGGLATLVMVRYFQAARGSEKIEWRAPRAIYLLAAAGLVVVAGWLAPLLRWASRSYTITTKRVIVSRGLLSRVRHEVLLSRVTDVSVHRRGLQAVFRSGDVIVNDDLVLADVPSAGLVQAAIHELADATFPSFPSAMVHP